jgi:hypothetical protein
MGALDDALADAGQDKGEDAGGGAAVNQGAVELQEGDPGSTAEDQIDGEGTLPAQEGSGQEGRTMPTDPQTAKRMEAAE